MEKLKHFLLAVLLICSQASASDLYPWPINWSLGGLASWAQPLIASGSALPSDGDGAAGDLFVLTDGASMTWYRHDGSGFKAMTGSGSGSGTATHSALTNLDFASSGHTGFESASAAASISLDLAAHQANQIDPHGATETISQSLQIGSGTPDAFFRRYATGVVEIATWALIAPSTASPTNPATGTLWNDPANGLKVHDENGSWSKILTDYPRWQDLRVSLLSTNAGGSAPPSVTKVRDDGAGSQGIFAWSFSATVEQELYTSVQIPHGITKTKLHPHVHWTSSQAVASTTVWALEYVIANYSATYPATSTIITVNATHSGTPYSHNLNEFQEIDISGAHDSAVMLIRFFRKATDGADDAAACWATDLDFHYQIGVLGSNDEYGDND